MSAGEGEAIWGVYAPIVEEDAPTLTGYSNLIAGKVSDFLLRRRLVDVPGAVTPRTDFGLTYVSHAAMRRLLRRYPDNTYSSRGMVKAVQRSIQRYQPDAPVEVPARAEKITFSDMQKSLRLSVPRIRALAKPAERLTFVFDTFGMQGATVKQPNHLSVADLAWDELPDGKRLSGPDKVGIRTIMTEAAQEVGLATLRFGGVVIGSDYREPAPGSGWPPQTR